MKIKQKIELKLQNQIREQIQILNHVNVATEKINNTKYANEVS